MKPDDILNAIGDVEDKLVKKARRRYLLRAICAGLAVFLLLVWLSGFLMAPDYLLPRYNPDLTVRTGFVDMDTLDGRWSAMRYTGAAGTSEFRRTVMGEYTLICVDNTGTASRVISYKGADYLDEVKAEKQYVRTSCGTDRAGRLEEIRVMSMGGHPLGEGTLNWVEFEYDPGGTAVRQTRYAADGHQKVLLGERRYVYEDGVLTASTDHDAEGNRTGSTKYVYTDTGYLAASYDAGGGLTGSVHCEYDFWGRLKTRVHLDADGNRIGTEAYSYRFWETYRSLEGICVAVTILSLSLLAAFTVYEDRIRLPMGKKE